jgi:cbb3-type cytochrome oxidase subunit 3
MSNTGTILVIFFFLAVVIVGGIAVVATTPQTNSQGDTFGVSSSALTNSTINTVNTTATVEEHGEGMFLILLAIIFMLIIGFAFRNQITKGLGGGFGKYRT